MAIAMSAKLLYSKGVREDLTSLLFSHSDILKTLLGLL
jgi:hypothetical protein